MLSLPKPAPLAYLNGAPNRVTHGAKLYWTDEANGKKTYIAVDCITSFELGQFSTVTQFPVQDGTTYSDHVIHFPDQVKAEIIQTNSPFEDIDPGTGNVIEFTPEDVELTLPKTSFRPKGLLLLSVAAETGARAALGAIGLPLPGLSSGALMVDLRKNPNFRDRINELIDSLIDVRLNARLLTMQWLGRMYAGFAIEGLTYKRTSGTTKGFISLVLKQVVTTSTETTQLPRPAELRLKSQVNGGNRPAVKPKSQQEEDEYASAAYTMTH